MNDMMVFTVSETEFRDETRKAAQKLRGILRDLTKFLESTEKCDAETAWEWCQSVSAVADSIHDCLDLSGPARAVFEDMIEELQNNGESAVFRQMPKPKMH